MRRPSALKKPDSIFDDSKKQTTTTTTTTLSTSTKTDNKNEEMQPTRKKRSRKEDKPPNLETTTTTTTTTRKQTNIKKDRSADKKEDGICKITMDSDSDEVESDIESEDERVIKSRTRPTLSESKLFWLHVESEEKIVPRKRKPTWVEKKKKHKKKLKDYKINNNNKQ